MEGELTRREVAARIAELAFARPDDAVRLALSPEAGTQGMDLRLVSDIKRGANGAVELRLLDREALIRLLTELIKPDAAEASENLYRAIDDAAKKLEDKPDAV